MLEKKPRRRNARNPEAGVVGYLDPDAVERKPGDPDPYAIEHVAGRKRWEEKWNELLQRRLHRLTRAGVRKVDPLQFRKEWEEEWNYLIDFILMSSWRALDGRLTEDERRNLADTSNDFKRLTRMLFEWIIGADPPFYGLDPDTAGIMLLLETIATAYFIGNIDLAVANPAEIKRMFVATHAAYMRARTAEQIEKRRQMLAELVRKKPKLPHKLLFLQLITALKSAGLKPISYRTFTDDLAAVKRGAK